MDKTYTINFKLSSGNGDLVLQCGRRRSGHQDGQIRPSLNALFDYRNGSHSFTWFKFHYAKIIIEKEIQWAFQNWRSRTTIDSAFSLIFPHFLNNQTRGKQTNLKQWIRRKPNETAWNQRSWPGGRGREGRPKRSGQRSRCSRPRSLRQCRWRYSNGERPWLSAR